jgi:hypothetical protein
VICELPRLISTCILGINLLVCNTSLSREAAAAFHGNNTFAFQGYHNWILIVSWLKVIGHENRNMLRSLEISAEKPEQAWQTLTGKRIRAGNGSSADEIYPRHPYFEKSKGSIEIGMVDNLNPVIEEIFALIGKRSLGRELTMSMELPTYYPGHGTECPGKDQHPEEQ